MKLPRTLPLLFLTPFAAAILLLFVGCTAVSEEDGEDYTPPPLPASSIGRLRPDANLTPGQ